MYFAIGKSFIAISISSFNISDFKNYSNRNFSKLQTCEFFSSHQTFLSSLSTRLSTLFSSARGRKEQKPKKDHTGKEGGPPHTRTHGAVRGPFFEPLHTWTKGPPGRPRVPLNAERKHRTATREQESNDGPVVFLRRIKAALLHR